MRKIGKIVVDKITPRLVWDLFMVWVALINLGLIAFDLSYLWLRPYYFRYLPVVTRIYDPVKGIEPHPLTERFLTEIQAASSLADLAPGSPELAERLGEIRRLMVRIVVENPFERSGLGHNLELLKQYVARETGHVVTDLADPATLRRAVDELWSGSPATVRTRLDAFLAVEGRPLRENYFREFDRSGHMVDHFWILDLPFLLLFWIEFTVRWAYAIRHRTYARWFFFPIFNWYDVLGLVPVGFLRVFRLLRLASMYMRLRRSELSNVGRDAISRSVEYISNIVTEEVSDRVAIRILEEYAEEIRDGTHIRIIRETVGSRRDQIESVLVDEIRALLTDPAIQGSFRELLRLNLERAVDESRSLHAVPLPNAVLRPVIRTVGEVVLDATLETITATVASDDGEAAVRDAASSVLDRLFSGPGLAEAERVAKAISLDVIEHMKSTVAVKKWALPDHRRRQPHSLAEVLDDLAQDPAHAGNRADDPQA